MGMFPDDSDDLVSSRRFVTSFGEGRSIQLCLLHENILVSAVCIGALTDVELCFRITACGI